MEQEQYQQFVHTHVKTNHHLYNFIHPDIWNYFKVTDKILLHTMYMYVYYNL